MTYSFLPEARDELSEAVTNYDNAKPGLGDEFDVEVEATIQRILTFPQGWPAISKRFRQCKTKRFPYGLIYELRGDEVVIVAVAHLHRKPGFWKRRI
jgi:hypothetical protein